MNTTMTAPNEKLERWTRRITLVLTVLMRFVSSHWLALANLALGLYLALPLLAPVLMESGHPRTGQLLYTIFTPLCHQLPERSFFLFGEKWVYSYAELSRFLGGVVPARYIGAVEIGFKAAVCQRDVAIYGFMVLGGVGFSLVRRRLKPLSWKLFGLLILPLAVDGTGQLVGLWTSTWLSRVVTGALFGLACIWLAYPYVEQGMREVRQETTRALQEWRS